MWTYMKLCKPSNDIWRNLIDDIAEENTIRNVVFISGLARSQFPPYTSLVGETSESGGEEASKII